MSNNKKELKGLGGWLILVGIGVVTTPILMVRDLLSSLELFRGDDLKIFIESNSEFYNPQFLYFVYGETIVNVLMLIAAIYAFYLFFAKHYRFPKFYIGLTSCYFIVLLLDTVILGKIFPEIEQFDEDTIKELVKSLMRICIWIPYLLLSVRVKNTFIEKKNNSI